MFNLGKDFATDYTDHTDKKKKKSVKMCDQNGNKNTR